MESSEEPETDPHRSGTLPYNTAKISDWWGKGVFSKWSWKKNKIIHTGKKENCIPTSLYTQKLTLNESITRL